MELKENVIEWLTGKQVVTVTLTQPRYISKVKKLAKTHPGEVKILHTNKDGSIVAHLPLKAVKLSIVTRNLKKSE